MSTSDPEASLPATPYITDDASVLAADKLVDEAIAAEPQSALVGYGRAAALGVVAGLRSATPAFALTAAIHRDAERSEFAPRPQPYTALRSQPALILSGLAALGEIVADKLPFTPSRVKPLPLSGRAVSGAVAGAAVARDARLSPPVGAVLGALGALAGSFGGYQFRTGLARLTGLPDLPLALLEDAITVGLAYTILNRER